MTAGDERGQVAAMWAVLAVALLVLGGLVHDGGRVLAARRQAANLARQAARAGAQALDETGLRAGEVVLDPAAAEEAARAWLARRELVPTAVVVEGDTVTVSVEATQPTPLLALVGIDRRTVAATATARAARGVAGEEP